MTRGLERDPGLPVSQPTKSYWLSPPRLSLLNIQTPNLPSTRDVVIIGSGITGCSVAYWLLKGSDTLSISILDAREICSGATGRNGGRINCPAVQDYTKYRRLYGHETARSIVKFELAHYSAIQSLVEELGPELLEESEIRNVDAVACAFSDQKLTELRRMLQDFEQAFPELKGVWRIAERDEAVQKFKVNNAKGALIGKAGAAWPYRMVTGIYEALLSRYGGRLSLEANTPALAIAKDTSSAGYLYAVRTSRGVIRATHVVHCAEGHTAHNLALLRGILVPRRGQMTVQNPGSGFPQHGDCSYNFYVNNMDYATQNPRTGELFLGGGDELGHGASLGISSDAGQSLSALSHLGGLLPAAFGVEQWGHEIPGRPRLKAFWTGILCNSLDHLPLVGLLPQEALDRLAGDVNSGEWISAGYGGYGMVNVFLCGKAVAKMMLGENVSSWLPKEYVATSARMAGLQAKLRQVVNSDSQHTRALL